MTGHIHGNQNTARLIKFTALRSLHDWPYSQSGAQLSAHICSASRSEDEHILSSSPAGSSTPSYSRWASDIVLDGDKPSLDEASCCRVLVMKGGAGCLETSLSEVETTCKRKVQVS